MNAMVRALFVRDVAARRTRSHTRDRGRHRRTALTVSLLAPKDSRLFCGHTSVCCATTRVVEPRRAMHQRQVARGECVPRQGDASATGDAHLVRSKLWHCQCGQNSFPHTKIQIPEITLPGKNNRHDLNMGYTDASRHQLQSALKIRV